MNKYISYFGNSDLGKNRSNNEDAFVAQYIWDDKAFLAAAIDGVGGYEGGEIAASIARQSIVEYLVNYPNGEPADLIKQAVVYANNAINKERLADSVHPNMSCVLTAALFDVDNGYLHMAHVGDTRLYQFKDDEIRKLSHDHSVIGYREEVGDLTEEEAMHHPQRNIIGRDAGSQSLDINTDLVETESFPLESNSIYLLCSDGLSDMLKSSEMVKVLSTDMGIEQKTNALIDMANAAGGNDNITVVLVGYTGPTLCKASVPKIEENKQNKEDNIALPSSKDVNKEEVITKHKTSDFVIIKALLLIIVILLFVICGLLSCVLYVQTQTPVKSVDVKCSCSDSIATIIEKDTTASNRDGHSDSTPLLDELQNN